MCADEALVGTQALWSELLYPQISLLSWLLFPPSPFRNGNSQPRVVLLDDVQHPTAWNLDGFFFVLLKIKKQFPSPSSPPSPLLSFSFFLLNQQSLENWNKTEWKLCQNVYTLSALFTFFLSHVPDFTNQHPNRTQEWHLKNKVIFINVDWKANFKGKSIIRNALVACLLVFISFSLVRFVKRNHKLCMRLFCVKINGSAAKCFKMKFMSPGEVKEREAYGAKRNTISFSRCHLKVNASSVFFMWKHRAIITKPTQCFDAIEKWSTLTVFICTINLQCLIGRNQNQYRVEPGLPDKERRNR